MTNLVLQSFGKQSELNRAILTVLSFYAHTSTPVEQTRIVLFTDCPQYFTGYLDGLPVEYIVLSPDKIKRMRGNIDFLHRMKIAMIEEAFGMIDGNMIYADSDTFFTDDPSSLVDQVASGSSFMHMREYAFEELRHQPLPAGEPGRAFLRLIESKYLTLADGSTIKISPHQFSWNAGVMFLHRSHARFLPDVYTLTDQFYLPSQSPASEQFAFSIILQERTAIKPCESVVYHYWYRVKKQIVDEFLEKKINGLRGGLPLPQKLTEVKKWAMFLPSHFQNNILTYRDNAIQAFHKKLYKEGYQWALRAVFKHPLGDIKFLKDVLYHFRAHLIK